MKIKIFSLLIILCVSVTAWSQGVGINETGINPNASSILDVSSTTKGFLPPRMTSLERDAIVSPTQGLMIYNTTANCIEIYNEIGWFNTRNKIVYGPTITSGDCQGEPEFIIFKGLEYRTVVSAGVCWLDRNLGATQVATSSTDADSYGELYQWGRAADGHQLRSSQNYDGNLNASSGVDNFNNNPANPWFTLFILRARTEFLGAYNANSWFDNTLTGTAGLWLSNHPNNPCPDGYRVPTQAEWDTERQSWSPNNNAAGAFGSPLKLPMAGRRDRTNGSLSNEGTQGNYWSATITANEAFRLRFDSGNAISTSTSTGQERRSFGFSVRCRKN